MRKALNKKFSGSSKLVGRIFQRQKSGDVACKEMKQDCESLTREIESLKDEIDCLKTALNSLKIETEQKDIKLGKLAREKEKLSMSLAKVKRSNENLTRQLEDERNFYYKEKESYCQEMNECKKLKKALSGSTVSTQIDNREELEKLKKTLEQTLQTNYNLSVKFLRMKETKNLISNTFDKAEEDHKRVVNDLKHKIEILTTELKEILNQKFNTPLSPSNKKYLHLVNQNSSLVYENLYLQMQIDNIHLKRNKIHKTQSDPTYKPKNDNTQVVKIFERDKRRDLPTVRILDEGEISLKAHRHRKKLPVVNSSKMKDFQASEVQPQSSVSAKVKKRSKSAPKILQNVSFK